MDSDQQPLIPKRMYEASQAGLMLAIKWIGELTGKPEILIVNELRQRFEKEKGNGRNNVTGDGAAGAAHNRTVSEKEKPEEEIPPSK